MNRRIFGIETEYGLTAPPAADAKPSNEPLGVPPEELQVEAIAHELFTPVVAQYKSTNVFLPNGGRLYLDVGAHPEYATAECSSLWDLLAQVRAGADMLADLAAQTTASLREQGHPVQVHLLANNLDSQGNSFGCHENYLLRRGRDFRQVADALITFLATRQIIAGAGDVKVDEDGVAHYVFAARSDQMHDALSSATTRSRPIINTRDEPLADTSSYRRLHVIVGDTNVAEPTTALKVAATDLVIGALERGVQLSDLALADPMAAIRQINQDITGQAEVALADGRSLTAAQIQREIMRRVLASHPAGTQAAEEGELPEIYAYLVGLWGRALDAVESGDWSGIDTEIDFAIKKKLLDSYRQRSGAAWDDPRVARLALLYHDITEGGLQPRMEQSGLMLRLTTPAQVEYAAVAAPPTTRAALRGRAIEAAHSAGRELGADWVNLRLEGEGIAIQLQDPFAVQDPRVQNLIDVLGSEGE